MKNKKTTKILFLLAIVTILSISLASAITFEEFLVDNLSFFGDDATTIIISLLIVLIIYAGLYDILELVGIFQNKWVKLVIAFAMGSVLVVLQFPIQAASFIIAFGAGLGLIGIVMEIVITAVIFIGLVWGSGKAAKWAALRKGNVEQIKAIKSAGQAAGAIRGLRELQEEFHRGS